MEIKRRDFLKLFGSVSGGVLLAGCGLDDIFALPKSLVERARNGPGTETWQNTVCGLCPAGCGLSVRLIDGIPVSVKGNTLHPVNRGALCPLGLNTLHSLYHPDRIQGPMKRIGKPGQGSWETTSWDEALTTISDTLVRLRAEGRSHEVGFLGHTERGVMKRHIARFMQAYGSPNYYQSSSLQNNTVPFALQYGRSSVPSFDILNAKLILSFGANYLEEGYSPVYYTKLYSHHREQDTRYIVADSRLSLTAANADEWVPLRPGTYGALALGIAYVLIREELYDSEFVRTRTFGFEDWTDGEGIRHGGFRDFVLGNYYPERVSELTGVPSQAILRIARDLGSTKPALVMCDHGALDNTNGVFTAMAAHSINALLGNVEQEGGIFFPEEVPFASLPAVQPDAAARKCNAMPPIALSSEEAFPLTEFSMETLTQSVLSGKPYPLSVLFLYGGNPLFQAVNRRELTHALEKIPLIVSFDTLVSETSEFAHLVLPDHHFLEKWDEVSGVESISFSHVGFQHPVVAPLYDSRQTPDVLIQLARRIGEGVSPVFPHKTYEEELAAALKGLYESGEGAVISPGVGSLWLEYLRQRGWQIGRYSSFGEFREQLEKQGGWWNPIRKKPLPDKTFGTPSKKFEFYSQNLKRGIDELVTANGAELTARNLERALNRLNITARGDQVYLPHYEPVPYDEDMPFVLTTFRVLPVHDGQGACLPMMQEMFGYAVRSHWESWAELSAETAKQVGVSDGGMVWVESMYGNFKVRVKVTDAVMPNCVAVPFGLGHVSFGRYARGRGVNPNSIMRKAYDSVSGKPALQATKVRLFPAT